MNIVAKISDLFLQKEILKGKSRCEREKQKAKRYEDSFPGSAVS